jgi:class 3 adenylate cyclase
MGDGFMSFFNAPNDQPDHAELALECARKVVQLKTSMGDLHFGVGVNTGIAVAGTVGSLRVMDYTAIGTTTNIASRFEKLAGAGEVVFGESTRFFSGDKFPYTVINDVTLKGITRPVRIYKLVV